MARYRFSLQKILEYRKMLYDQAVWQFSPISGDWGNLEREQDRIEKEKQSYFDPSLKGASFQEAYLKERYYQALRLKKVEVGKKQEKFRPYYMKERTKVLKAFQNLDFMEKLAKSSFDAYKRSMRKKEKNQLDDITMTCYVARGDN